MALSLNSEWISFSHHIKHNKAKLAQTLVHHRIEQAKTQTSIMLQLLASFFLASYAFRQFRKA